MLSILCLLLPGTVVAEIQDTPVISNPLPEVLITEVQPGLSGASASEFIELYNTTDTALSLAGWQLWYVPATATADLSNPSRVVTLGSEDEPILLPAQGHYVLATPNYLTAIAQQTYDFSVASSGTWRLLSPIDPAVCTLREEDLVGWGSARFFDGQPVSLSSSKQAIARMVNAEGDYINYNNTSIDFMAIQAPTQTTPGQKNTQNFLTAAPAVIAPHVDPIIDPHCEPVPVEPELPPDVPVDLPPATEPPAIVDTPPASASSSVSPVSSAANRNAGLAAPLITELLPNPAAPQTDAVDEFIELYNANEQAFDLSGYVLEVGVSTKRRYTFSEGSVLPPKSFRAFFAADTRLALSNMSGQARLLDTSGRMIAQSSIYSTAKDGQVWALANGAWHWTITPTPNTTNVIKAPAVTGKKATAKNTKDSSTAAKDDSRAAYSTAAQPEADALQTVASSVARTPLHPSVLALVGVFAVLYGAYEYRGDVANKLYQYRANRAARRSLGQDPEGRRSVGAGE